MNFQLPILVLFYRITVRSSSFSHYVALESVPSELVIVVIAKPQPNLLRHILLFAELHTVSFSFSFLFFLPLIGWLL